MEPHPPAATRVRDPQVIVLGPDGRRLAEVRLAGERVSVGRLPEANDIALEPDPEQLVTRVAHCSFERQGGRWFVVDGGGVNGTFVRHGEQLQRVSGQTALQDGDSVCVLASLSEGGDRGYFELLFDEGVDSQATRAAQPWTHETERRPCLEYDPAQARLVLVQADERLELQIRAQAHRLVAYMAARNAAIGGTPALCTHDELMHAVWGDEPMHSRTELAKLVWELRRQLEPLGAADLIENERRRGYRLRTCSRR